MFDAVSAVQEIQRHWEGDWGVDLHVSFGGFFVTESFQVDDQRRGQGDDLAGYSHSTITLMAALTDKVSNIITEEISKEIFQLQCRRVLFARIVVVLVIG